MTSMRGNRAIPGALRPRGRRAPSGVVPRGRVLPRLLTRVVLPRRNAPDLDEVPAEARAALEFILADDMSEVIGAALEPAATPSSLLSSREDTALRIQSAA